MRIDQTKLSKLVVELDSELKSLEAEQHKRALSPEEKERLRRQLQDTRERQRALSQILLRHSLYLDVGRRIFVSTRLERDARPPSWLSIVLERVNELCQLSDQPAFDFQDDFPNKLKQALEEAPREQRESVERRRKIVSRLFR